MQGKVFYGQQFSRGEFNTTVFVRSIMNYCTCSNAAEVAHWATPSCSRPQLVRTISSETLDPIDWPLPSTLYRAVAPEHHLYSTNRHSLCRSRTCNLFACEATNLRMWPLRVYGHIYSQQHSWVAIKFLLTIVLYPTLLLVQMFFRHFVKYQPAHHSIAKDNPSQLLAPVMLIY